MKVNLDRCWSFWRKAWGPGETDIPDELHDILSSKGYLEVAPDTAASLEDLDGIGSDLARNLREAGYETPDDLKEASDEDLLAIDGLGNAKVKQIREDLG